MKKPSSASDEGYQNEAGEEGFCPQLLYLWGKIPFDTMFDTNQIINNVYCPTV